MKKSNIKKIGFVIGIIVFMIGLFVMYGHFGIVQQQLYGEVSASADEGVKMNFWFSDNPQSELILGIIFILTTSTFIGWLSYIYLKFKYKK